MKMPVNRVWIAPLIGLWVQGCTTCTEQIVPYRLEIDPTAGDGGVRPDASACVGLNSGCTAPTDSLRAGRCEDVCRAGSVELGLGYRSCSITTPDGGLGVVTCNLIDTSCRSASDLTRRF